MVSRKKELPTDASPAKKLSLLYILEILRRYSDAEHPLSQQDILDFLAKDYGMDLDRKAVKRNLMNLLAAGYPLANKPWTRQRRDRDRIEQVYGSWYYEHGFSPVELTAVIDSLLFTHLPKKQVMGLVGKLLKLQSIYYRNPALHMQNLPNENWPDRMKPSQENERLWEAFRVINEAIENHCMMRFQYLSYDTDKKATPRLIPETRQPYWYEVSPYAMVATNGRFYLIANKDGYDDISHYRIDRIAAAEVIPERFQRPKRGLIGMENNKLDLPKHLAEHVNMFAGPAESCTFRIARSLMNQVIDAFGKKIRVLTKDDETVVLRVRVNPKALYHWALQFGSAVKILAPQELATVMRATAEELMHVYLQEEPEYYRQDIIKESGQPAENSIKNDGSLGEPYWDEEQLDDVVSLRLADEVAMVRQIKTRANARSSSNLETESKQQRLRHYRESLFPVAQRVRRQRRQDADTDGVSTVEE